MHTARKLPVLTGMVLMTSIVGANYTDSLGWVMALMTLSFFGNGLASITWIFVSSLAPVRLIGLVGGVFNFCGGLSAATVPAIIGWLARRGDFQPVFLFIGIISLLGFCSYLFLVGKVERIATSAPDVRPGGSPVAPPIRNDD